MQTTKAHKNYFYLQDGFLNFFGKKIDLRTKPQVASIFNLFVNGNFFISRDLLLRKIYNKDYEKLSIRQQDCLKKNLVKALSRARNETSSLKVFGEYRLEWFVFDKFSASWSLFHVTTHNHGKIA